MPGFGFPSPSQSQPTSKSTTPAPTTAPSQPPQPTNQQRQAPAPADPFASIASIGQRQPSPFDNFKQQASPNPATTPSQTTQTSNGASNNDADEWQFASSLPASTNEVLVSASPVHIILVVTRPVGSDTSLSLLARFSNASASPITDLTFEVAVTKVRLHIPLATDAWEQRLDTRLLTPSAGYRHIPCS